MKTGGYIDMKKMKLKYVLPHSNKYKCCCPSIILSIKIGFKITVQNHFLFLKTYESHTGRT